MPLKKSTGNMYTWVTHTHTHLGGECQHKCVYCYVDNPRWGRPMRYQGPIRLIEKELNVDYGSGKTIFIENCNDLFASDVPDEFIIKILNHCYKYPANIYVFQSKNPARMLKYELPKGSIIGTTIETNRDIKNLSEAPSPFERMIAMKGTNKIKFLTVEPVLDFDVDILAKWIDNIKPKFLNLGADSKGHNLSEPSYEKIMALTEELKKYGIELREKHNLQRLK
ncbi:MAG: DUF5131 family protein [Candidatus Nanoarchaeia archaeon]|nr:DUF5131 family protein [Candidatus Nanoarchaeia archaeon]